MSADQFTIYVHFAVILWLLYEIMKATQNDDDDDDDDSGYQH